MPADTVASGPPMVPPRGDGGTASPPLTAGGSSLLTMRTSALRVSVGAYSDGTWHVAQIADHYERGVLVNSEIESLSHPETWEQVQWNVRMALDRMRRREQERMATEGAGEPQPENLAPSVF